MYRRFLFLPIVFDFHQSKITSLAPKCKQKPYLKIQNVVLNVLNIPLKTAYLSLGFSTIRADRNIFEIVFSIKIQDLIMTKNNVNKLQV